jgi:hypothetical protein
LSESQILIDTLRAFHWSLHSLFPIEWSFSSRTRKLYYGMRSCKILLSMRNNCVT